MLSKQHKNVVNNLVARDDMSFVQVRQHLYHVDFNLTSQTSAFLTNAQNDDNPVRITSAPSVGKVRECTYCKRYSPSSAKGHYWQFCRKMKAAKRKEKTKKARHTSNEVANMTTSVTDKTVSPPSQFTEGL
ncbi:hypothetical protein K3495_g7151 [Podosphaera aphanis]|nr:hypothetical protein K3495_g7151 [Podosphaera aphanis]